MLDFCVLMSLYKNDEVVFLNDSLDSILVNQSVLPSQVVLVMDGQVSVELNNAVKLWEESSEKVLVIRVPDNVGLSNAMNIGLKYCEFDIVFRMDADDVSTPDRFEKQLRVFLNDSSVSMVGGYYRQFDSLMEKQVGDRLVPLKYQDIKRFGFRRTPINHVSVAFKLSDALAVGGYPDTRLPFEDWWLALRFIKGDKKIVNIPEFLVDVRSGPSFYSRRSGLTYLKQEISAMFHMYKEGILPLFYAVTNILIRTPVRLAPSKLITLFYERLLR